MKQTLVFDLHKSKILNSNSLAGLHFIVKGKAVAALREIGYQTGIEFFSEQEQALRDERKKLIDSAKNNAIIKSRLTKKLKKEHGELTGKQLQELVDTEYAQTVEPIDDPSSIAIEPLFKEFEIQVEISPPTRRRLDPPNLYPTLKPIIDGLTDAAWWDDDDYTHLKKMSFAYGGLSPQKDTFQVKVTVIPLEDAGQ